MFLGLCRFLFGFLLFLSCNHHMLLWYEVIIKFFGFSGRDVFV